MVLIMYNGSIPPEASHKFCNLGKCCNINLIFLKDKNLIFIIFIAFITNVLLRYKLSIFN